LQQSRHECSPSRRIARSALRKPGVPRLGLNLLVAAIILWNSRYLAAAFESLRRDGQPLRPDIMKHVAPLGWEHISLTGDYIWNERSQPTDGQLRPLRRPPSLLAA
jgi:Tn3 transposase DDE domain